MKSLITYVSESIQYNKKSMISAASYLSNKGFWERFCNQLKDELNFSKSDDIKSWDKLSKEQQKKVSDFQKSLKKQA